MCRCTPYIRTPFCGRPGCVAPVQAPAPTAAPASDGLGLLASAAGLTVAECQVLAAEVRANHALLDSCRAHNFETPIDPPGARINSRWRCSVCTGVVDASAKRWYERGRDHGHSRGPALAGRSDASRSLETPE